MFSKNKLSKNMHSKRRDISIPKFIWDVWNDDDEQQSEDIRKQEWTYAKQHLMPNGKLRPAGTKLRREEHNYIQHSFIVLDKRIFAMSGKGIYLGVGIDGVGKLAEGEQEARLAGKLAEDEQGRLIVLKVLPHKGKSETAIAKDLRKAGPTVFRKSKSKDFPKKYYLSFQYLGISLATFLEQNPDLSLDECYEFSIKIALALHDLHTGKKSKSKTSYLHGDIHIGNITVNNQGEVHLIDFGRTRKIENVTGEKTQHDINDLFEKVFFSSYEEIDTIFAKFFLKYNADSQIQYICKDSQEKNKVLYDLMTGDRTEFFKGMQPSALDIAELLTLCRFHLEPYHKLFYKRVPAEREKTIRMLNAANEQIFGLHEKLNSLGMPEDIIKKYFVYKLLKLEIDLESDVYRKLNQHQLNELSSSINQLIPQIELPDLKEEYLYPFNEVTSPSSKDIPVERKDTERLLEKKRDRGKKIKKQKKGGAHKIEKQNEEKISEKKRDRSEIENQKKREHKIIKQNKNEQTKLSHDASKVKVNPQPNIKKEEIVIQPNIKKKEIVITSKTKASATTNVISPVLSTVLSNAKNIASSRLPTYYTGISFFKSFMRTFDEKFVKDIERDINSADNVFELLYWLDAYTQEVNQKKGHWRPREGSCYYSALRKRLEDIKNNVVNALKEKNLGDILEIYHKKQYDLGSYKREKDKKTGTDIYKLKSLPTHKLYRREKMQNDIDELKSTFSNCVVNLHQEGRMEHPRDRI